MTKEREMMKIWQVAMFVIAFFIFGFFVGFNVSVNDIRTARAYCNLQAAKSTTCKPAGEKDGKPLCHCKSEWNVIH